MIMTVPESRTLALADLAATAQLAAALAARARVGDVIALSGGLGAGKTAFARAFIHARRGGDGVSEVPSPTFTLVQIYDLPDGAVWHLDLYRIKHPEEAFELGLEEALAEAITLIEWPERLGTLLPAARLDLALVPGEAPDARRAVLTPHGTWAARIADLGVADQGAGNG
jgi:tRNA threonylcarbamoyladenosine biosynthesis protein TsaE